MRQLSIIRPDDWHVHFRDVDYLPHTVPASSMHFARALVMPNLKPALTNLEQLIAYHQRISAANTNHHFTPYLTFYLNEHTSAENLQQAKQYPYILGAKFYPAGVTTNSDHGAHTIKSLYPSLEIMQDNNLVLQIHGEVNHGDIFDREALFIVEHLAALIRDFPKLRIVLEHISTRAAVDFVSQAPKTVAATITPHHLLFNRNHLLAGGIKPHLYCLPILKHEGDQQALQQAATSGNPKFFAGTDSAPHAQESKENACGCAGIFSAPYAVAMYAQVFANLDSLNSLEAFMGKAGAEFYQLSTNTERIELIEKAQQIAVSLPFGNQQVIPVAAGQTLQWSVNEPA